MPLYEFECKSCGHTFDKVMTITEVETCRLDCPVCGSDDVVRVMSSGRIKVGLEGYAGKIR